MIDQILHQTNSSFFAPLSMRLDLLKNCPQTIPILAQWLYDDWHSYDSSLTKEIAANSFAKCLKADTIPIAFVVLKNNIPVGVISLKRQNAPEFSDFPANTIWGGSLHVIPTERNKGIGRELSKFATIIAKSLGYPELYFYTSNPVNVKWYVKKGAQILENRPFRNHTVTIFKFVSK